MYSSIKIAQENSKKTIKKNDSIGQIITLTGLVAASFCIYKHVSLKDGEASPIVIQYEQTSNALQSAYSLKNYLDENPRGDLESKFFLESLDNKILQLKQDAGNISNTAEYKSYEKNSSDARSWLLGGIALFFAGIGSGAYFLNKSNKKHDNMQQVMSRLN
ncbi:MAG TPA: hypothetical protein VEC16_02830 [Alphaproteobacteria bacterium]|nr:hypothetical protein [Alphaproteobacteria bacterium]